MAKNRYTFIKKTAPAAKESILFSAISLGLFVLDIILSCVTKGGGAVLGAIGLFAMLVAMYGFYLGVKAISDRGTNHLVTAFGTIFAGVMSIGWIGIFLLGMQ
jgi:dolichyl-phosphate-mannose--protein O-mannosyl transferase